LYAISDIFSYFSHFQYRNSSLFEHANGSDSKERFVASLKTFFYSMRKFMLSTNKDIFMVFLKSFDLLDENFLAAFNTSILFNKHIRDKNVFFVFNWAFFLFSFYLFFIFIISQDIYEEINVRNLLLNQALCCQFPHRKFPFAYQNLNLESKFKLGTLFVCHY
jgi:hypothetical protein